MSIREFMNESEDVMFIKDFARNASPEGASQAPAHGSSTTIYDKVRDEQRRLENEWFIVDEKRQALAKLHERIASLTKRYQFHEKRKLEAEAKELDAEIESIAQGERIERFLERVQPYIYEYQRQQFCRPAVQTCEKSGLIAPEPVNAVINEFQIQIEKSIPKFDIQSQDMCATCKEPLQLYQALSLMVCGRCGQTKPFLDATASLLAYTDDYDYCSFSYKRINHFSEWLASIQAKESMDIPYSILETIMQRLHEQRIENIEEVTVHRIRDILKKEKMRKYYEHVQLITCKITGRSPPRMTPEMEEKIKVCFLAASAAFQRHCPSDRKNMISYQLVLLKLCELLGYHDFVPYFMLLKGRDKLSRMDSLWRCICDDLDWTFIPSVP